MFKKAFTLAEVLITLGIIGVVAALTIPTLIQDANDRAIIGQLKKQHTILQQAFTSARSEESPIDYWYDGVYDLTAAATAVNTIISPYLKVTKNCGGNTGCLPPVAYLYLNGLTSAPTFETAGYSKMILTDGTILIFVPGLIPIGSSYQLSNITIYVDVNGLKEPNRYGYDLFLFNIDSDATVGGKPGVVSPKGLTYGNINSYSCDSSTSYSNIRTRGTHCASWAVYQGNLDYKYVNDLNWTTKTHR